jgi:hypothetical protein
VEKSIIFKSNEGFWVSEAGRVFKEMKYVERGGSKNRYLSFSFKKIKYDVHRVVAKMFIPNPTNLPWVLHWDDNSKNNHVKNLRWGNSALNQRDIKRNMLRKKAIETNIFKHKYRLTSDDKNKMVQMFKANIKMKDIAQEFSLSASRVSQIIKASVF